MPVAGVCRAVRAIRATAAGGPDVLEPATSCPTPSPRPGEVLVRVAAAGVNFIDTYRRSGVVPDAVPARRGLGGRRDGRGASATTSPRSPSATGSRGASAPGSYAERVVVPGATRCRSRTAWPDDVAAALLLQGLTAHYLVTSTFPVSGRARRAAARGRRRRRAAAHPARRRARRPGHRDRRAAPRRRQPGPRGRRRRRDPVPELDDLTTRAAGPGAVADRRPGRARRVRRRRQGHLRRVARLAAAARRCSSLFGGSSGPVPPGRPPAAQRGRLAVPDPPHARRTTSPRATSSTWRARELFAAVRRRRRSTSASAPPSPWPTPPTPTARSRRAPPPGRSCCSRDREHPARTARTAVAGPRERPVNPLRVEIWSDIACPWCYIGKRRFAAALADFPHREHVEVTLAQLPAVPRGARSAPTAARRGARPSTKGIPLRRRSHEMFAHVTGRRRERRAHLPVRHRPAGEHLRRAPPGPPRPPARRRRPPTPWWRRS